MPSLNFVLPHWLYWAGLGLFPLLAMFLLSRRRAAEQKARATLPIAYFLLVTGGFVGIHRFYLRSALGWIFVPLFIAILLVNVQIRADRDQLSRTQSDQLTAEFFVERAEQALAEGRDGADERLAEARAKLATVQTARTEAEQSHQTWNRMVQALALTILALLVLDACLLPRLTRRCRERETQERVPDPGFVCPAARPPAPMAGGTGLLGRAMAGVDRLNWACGNFVAYWSAIAVFVYYYEVMARYVFNSPTNWAHESMFLMFGMQYLLAGGFALREDAHVRVDVFYTHLPPRGKAFLDVLTSAFFFIFVLTLLWTGWVFFSDSFQVREVSFTEWGIQYWPVKLSLPLGAALLLLQGISRLIKDILLLVTGEDRGA